MNEALEWFTTLFAIGIEELMTILLSSCFCSRYYSRKLYTLSILGYVTVESIWLLLWYYFLNGYIAIKYLVCALILLTWLLTAYRSSVIKSLFFITAIFSYLTIVDSFSMAIIVPAIPAISAKGILQFALQDPYVYSVIICNAKMMELFGVIIILNAAKKRGFLKKPFRWTEWAVTLFFPLSALIVSVIISRIIWTNLSYSKEYAVCMFIMLMLVLLSIYFLDQYNKSQQVIRDNDVLRQNLKLESNHIAALQESYEQQRKQTHDFYNHLATLQGMAEKGTPSEEFSKYLGTILATKIPVVFYINTHRTVVDIILSQKVSIARDKGIDFQLKLENLSHFPIPDDALVVILTNLIDNAIEACERISDIQDRFILLTMKMEKQIAWLCIENTTAEPVSIRDNFVTTTKDDLLLHGYGLKNITTLLSQCNGTYILDYRDEDRMFSFYSKIPILG